MPLVFRPMVLDNWRTQPIVCQEPLAQKRLRIDLMERKPGWFNHLNNHARDFISRAFTKKEYLLAEEEGRIVFRENPDAM